MKLRIALLLLLVAGAVALAFSGAYQELAPEKLRETLLGLGPLGPVLFVLAFACLEPFHVPGALFLLTAPLVWSPPVAFLLGIAGGTGAGLVAMAIARWLARDWVQERLPESWRAWDDRLTARGFRTVALIRILTFLLPAAHWAIGLSSVRVVPATLGTAVGLAPGTLLFVVLGASMAEWLGGLPLSAWLALALLAVGILAVRRLRAPASEPATPI